MLGSLTVGKFGEIWENLGKFGEIWENLGKFGKIKENKRVYKCKEIHMIYIYIIVGVD